MQNKENRRINYYNKYIAGWIPRYAIFSLIACFVINGIIYWGTQQLMKTAYHYDLTTDLDRMIPFIPEWVFVYLICYLFWAANYILIARQGKEEWYRFATADILSRCICGVIFIILPTTNIRPEIIGSGAANNLMRLVYELDAPYNLFPSIHCLVSWFCYIGIRGRKNISFAYRSFSCIFAILICASTQFTKQHYIVDVIVGIALAEICYYITGHTRIYQKVMKIFDSIDRMIFTEKETDY